MPASSTAGQHQAPAMTDAMPWHENAPAKINLFLHVTGRRDDGYHLLDSLVCFAGAGDVVHGNPRDDDTLTLHLSGPMASALSPVDDGMMQDNLVMRAARLLAERFARGRGADLVLEKHLPVASGIGGGSADAAATLRLLCRMWDIAPDHDGLMALALELGADVPVCLRGQHVLMQGIGETLVPVPALPHLPMVLVNPGRAVSTPAVFRARNAPFRPLGLWDSTADFTTGITHGKPDNIDMAKTAHALADALSECGNDLMDAASSLLDDIPRVVNALSAQDGCVLARMSGSGATCFGIYETHDAARTAAQRITHDHPGWWCRATHIC